MKETAVGYLGKPEDVANVVSFLVKKESHFITGKRLLITRKKKSKTCLSSMLGQTVSCGSRNAT